MKTIIHAIALTDKNGVMYSEDTRNFDIPHELFGPASTLTEREILILGRKTWETLPMESIPPRNRMTVLASRKYAPDTYEKEIKDYYEDEELYVCADIKKLILKGDVPAMWVYSGHTLLNYLLSQGLVDYLYEASTNSEIPAPEEDSESDLTLHEETLLKDGNSWYLIGGKEIQGDHPDIRLNIYKALKGKQQ